MSEEYREPGVVEDDAARAEYVPTGEPWHAGESPIPFESPLADAACENPPAPARRWSGTAVIAAAAAGSVVGAIVTGVLVVWAFGGTLAPRQPETGRVNATPVAARNVTIRTEESTSAIVAVADKVLPSVVNVAIQRDVRDPFNGQVRRQAAGNGSGVIIRSDGYILTNNHVIENASNVIIQMGTEELPARLVGRDPATDLAVLKVDRKGMPAADLGDSSKVRVGELAVAIGSPFGLQKTVTSGIISALERSDVGPSAAYTNLIQTDASINPGNSGGALVNGQGQVIGINTLIISPSGNAGAAQSAGVGLAIPINSARDIADQLIAKGRAEHPFLGVGMATADRRFVADLPVESGVLVVGVVESSPADRAGLQREDVILRIGDRVVTTYEEALIAIRAHKVGDEIEVEVFRGGRRVTKRVTLGSDRTSPR